MTGGAISARRLEKELGVNYKTARRLIQKLRESTPEGKPGSPLAFLRPPQVTAVAQHNLPVRLTSFVGRVHDIETVRGLTQSFHLVTLVGAGGCGKTRLALQIADGLLAENPDGVWWVDLSLVEADELVAATVAASVGLRGEPGVADLDALVGYLRTCSALVVFDNCEHVLDGCAQVMRALLNACGKLRLLATSREPVALSGEAIWRVPSLSTPSAASGTDLSTLGAFDAIRLFADRAAAVQPTFRLDPANADAVAQICRHLDGIPLAIEMAAARVAALSPDQIATALRDSFQILTGGRYSTLRRHQTLRASIEWSHTLLSEEEKVLLRRLGVFAGSFPLDAAESVCPDALLARGAVPHVLSRLVEKSLLSVEPYRAAHRYRLLETVRRYAMERLIDAGETATLRDRHLEWVLALVEQAAPTLVTASQTQWLDLLEAERANLRAALDWSISAGRGTVPLVLVGGLTPFFNIRVHLSEARRWFTDALAASGPRPSPQHARALWGAAYSAMNALDAPAARAYAVQALAMARTVLDTQTAARSLWILGWADVTSKPQTARTTLEEGLAHARECGDDWCTCMILLFIYRSWLVQGALERARNTLVAAHDVFVRVGDRYCLGWYWGAVALVELRAGHLAAAHEATTHANALASEVGDPTCAAWAVRCDAEIARWRGHASQVAATLASLNAAEGASLRNPETAMLLHVAAGKMALALGRLTDAEHELQRVCAIAPSGLDLAVAGETLVDLAEIALLRGQADRAATLADQARSHAEALDNAWLNSVAKVQLARAARARGDTDLARDFYHEALARQRDSGHRLDALTTLELLAGLHTHRGNHLDAARLYGAVGAERRRLGVRRRPLDTLRSKADRATLARSLDAATLRDCLHQGAALTLDEAVAYASRGRGRRRAGHSSGWDSLTPTEVAIARFVADGLTNHDIATRMLISVGTVKAHLGHMFGKLAITNRAELAAQATRHR